MTQYPKLEDGYEMDEPIISEGLEISTFIGLPTVTQIDTDLLNGYLQNLSQNVGLEFNLRTNVITLVVNHSNS